jgi:DNA-binding IclR family transcriptional regulator
LDGLTQASTTVLRAFAILDLLASVGEEGASAKMISRHFGMSKSTAFRYITTLEKLGVVERDQSDCFHLGLKLVGLAGALLSDQLLRKTAEPFLYEIVSKTQETAHLAVPIGNEVVYIAKVDSPYSLRMASHIGNRAPMYCTALGKTILSNLAANEVRAIINKGISERTPFTISSPEVLLKELEKVRNIGFAIDDQENEIGVRCVGAPIFDYTSKVIGAISVSGPENRLTHERSLELGPFMKETALNISNKMGYMTSN